jgi:RimJ/RimL family protein N-acetyltransferase
MIPITVEQLATLRPWFVPDRPGPLVGLHVIQTGNGTCLADRWPDPRALLVESAGNYTLTGDPRVLQPADLRGRVAGFLDAPARFLPLLQAAFPGLLVWDRVVLALEASPRAPEGSGEPQGGAPVNRARTDRHVRRLAAGDADLLGRLGEEAAWIGRTWGGPAGLVAGGTGWGAFAGGRLVSVACSFFVGERHEDVGVATEPDFRGQGLSTACAGAVCEDIFRRGRTPSWTTSPDNAASLRVAAKLGFALQRRDRLYVIETPIP